MSAGAVFNLILNDGKADRLIMATKLLNTRLRDVMCARRDRGMADITPTLLDIEKTHVLYVNAHFKPFCSIAFEYDKVRPSSGVTSLGSTVTFAIPTFGDFFHDMVCYVRLSKVTGVDIPGITQSSGGIWPTNAPNQGLFYQVVDAFGNIIGGLNTQQNVSSSYKNLIRYCEFPGNRLFKRVNFQVNGNPLDEYYDYTVAMLEKFCVPPNKRAGYNRLVGQETVYEGYSGPIQASISDSDNDNTLFPSINGAKQTQTCREKKFIVAGPQTPKLTQPPLEMWNKLRFWFNEDVRLSVPSVSIPYGNRFITVDLQDQSLLAFEFPGAYLKKYQFAAAVPQYFKPQPTGQGASPIPTQLMSVTYTPLYQPQTIPDIKVEFIELYVNNIFVNAEIHDIFIKRIGFSLIRVYRHHVASVNQEGSQSVRLDNLKWPIEYMLVGLRPTWNIKDANPNQWRDWHRMTRLIDASYGQKFNVEVPSAGSDTDGGLAAITQSDKVIKDTYTFPVNSVDSLTVTSHAIQIYDDYGTTFFHSYLPLHFGGPALNTPEDQGALFINFALFPRSYQPSGHFNMSRARETFIGWSTSYISASRPCDLIVVGIAINFLLISDGSAVLRYST